MHTVILDVRSRSKARCVPSMLGVSFFFISVTKLWHLIIRLCMCKSWMHHVKVLESKSHCKIAKMCSSFLQVTVKWQCKSNISDEMCEQNLSEWCHTCHRQRVQCAWRIDLNDNRYAQFIHVSNCITLCTDRVHMVEIFEIACGTSWKSSRRSWIRNGEEVELYLLTTSEMNHMPWIAGWQRGNVIRPRHVSLR